MEEQYLIINKSTKMCYIPTCPVILEKYHVLLDKQANRISAQLKMANIFIEEIIAVVVDIICFDSSGKQQPSREGFQYLNLGAKPGDRFGGRIAVALPSDATRDIKIRVTKVVTASGYIWQNSDGLMFQELQPQSRMNTLLSDGQRAQFARDSQKAGYKIPQYDYIPHFEEHYWQCCCGEINDNKRTKCANCQRDKAWLQQHIQLEFLDQEIKEHLQEERILAQKAREQEEILNKEKSIKQKKRKKFFALFFPLVAVFVLILVALTQVVPLRYAIGKTFFEWGKYGTSITVLNHISDYLDSQDYIDESEYYLAVSELENSTQGNNSGAWATIRSLALSIRTTDRAIAIKYKSAIMCYNASDYDTALQSFDELGEYLDSEGRVFEIKYREAQELMENGNYSDAAGAFDALGNYADSQDLSEQARYLLGKEYYSNQEYEKAINLYSGMDDYLDCLDLITQYRYEYALFLIQASEYSKALYQLEMINEYSNSQDLITTCLIALTLAINDSVEVKFTSQKAENYKGDAVLQSVVMTRISEDTVRFLFCFSPHSFNERVLFSTTIGNSGNDRRVFHSEKILGEADTTIFFDMKIDALLKSKFMWARYFVGSSDYGDRRTDIFVSNLSILKEAVQNYKLGTDEE